MKTGTVLLSAWLALGWLLSGWGLPGRWERDCLGLDDPASRQSVLESSSAALDRRGHDPLQKTIPVAGEETCDDYDGGAGFHQRARRYLLFTEDPDEGTTTLAISSMDPRRLDFDPDVYLYGGAFVYPAAGAVALGMLGGYIPREGGISHYLEYPEHMGRIYRVLRFLVFLSATLAALLLGWAFRARPWLGVMLGVMFVATPAISTWSLDAKPHVYGLVFLFLCWEGALRLLREPRIRWAWAAGGAAGLAAGTVLPFAPSILMPGIALLLGQATLARRAKLGILVGIAAGLAFLVTNPCYLLSSENVVRDMNHVRRYYPEGITLARLGPGLVLMAREALAKAVGVPLALLAVLGALVAVRRDWRHAAIPLGAALAYSATTGARLLDIVYDPSLMRFAMFLIPFTLVAAGIALGRLEEVAPRGARMLAGLVLVSMLPMSMTHYLAYGLESMGQCPMIPAREWIMENIPAGSTIGLYWDPAPFSAPPLPPGRYALVKTVQLEIMERCRPDFLLGQGPDFVPPKYEVLVRFQLGTESWPLTTHTGVAKPLWIARRKMSP